MTYSTTDKLTNETADQIIILRSTHCHRLHWQIFTWNLNQDLVMIIT